jgi:energy-coupling factor transporter ATP-binding protein EcfA2
MKISSATIRNFKGVREATLKLQQPGERQPDTLHAVLGDNGSGKTTILQAIALTLGLATRRVFALDTFPWYGFVPQRLSTMGKTRVELEVLLDSEEITATAQLFPEWRHHFERDGARLVEPGQGRKLTLVFENGRVRVTDEDEKDARAQLYGRFYVRQLARLRPDLKEYFGKVGDVFWYDQYRNLGKALATRDNGDLEEPVTGRPFEITVSGTGTTPAARFDTDAGPRESWIVGVDQLRRFLQDWWTYHISGYRTQGRDFIPELENLFSKVFPGTHFRGPQPIDTSGAEPAPRFFFLLERAGRVFDIAEMSSGEQALFPLICDIVRLNVRKSVVLIDELELHLHPPEQQALLSALPRMAPESQFIITTHSSFVEGGIPKEQETRLREGRLCL